MHGDQGTLFEIPVEQLGDALSWELVPLDHPTGSIEIFEWPDYTRSYALGADFSYGMIGRDYDAAIVLDAQEEPYRQVAQAHGWWGEQFHRVLFALGMLYNYSWIWGEAQLGLAELRQLLKLGYGRLYYNRDEHRKGRPTRDVLGYWTKSASTDLVLRRGRLAVREHRVIVRAESLFQELDRFAWLARSEAKKRLAHEELTDRDLIAGASVGNDDLVRALCGAIFMAEEAPSFEPIVDQYPHGTMGQILDHADVFGEDDLEG